MIAGEGGGREASGDVKQSMLNEEEEGKLQWVGNGIWKEAERERKSCITDKL